jgi:two-component system, NtrC family, response regulator AtoC
MIQPTDPARSRNATRPERRYLLVCDGDRARVVDLPERGTIAIGRSSECAVVLADSNVSRVHAEIELAHGRATVVDRDSQNGTRVGGTAIARHELVAGDVIEVGGATLVFHTTARVSAPRHVDLEAFGREIDREIERTRVTRRGFVVVSIRVRGAPAGRLRELVEGNLRAYEVASSGADGDVLVLCPEHDGDAAPLVDQLAALAGTVGAPAVGVASYPRDGFDAARLVAAARAGVSTASREPVKTRTLDVDDRRVVIAEPATQQLYTLVERLARSDIPVLVRGETGVGKEVVARALHAWSPRAKASFVAINCAALPEQLAESELFGHDKGAFSGAIATKLGLLEAARGGTVLLDEVGDMTLATQAKLLRALETKKITRLGSVEERAIDIRLVAATHRDLEADVESGRFRRDLYYRLGGGTLVLPPLRDRPLELVQLAESFLAAACAALGRPSIALSSDAILELVGYAWPGNVRELKHVMDYLAAVEPGRILTATHVAGRLGATPASAAKPAAAPAVLRDEVEELERRRITNALEAHDGHQSNAAAAIGMPLRTFVAKLKRYKIATVRRRG